MSLAEKLTKREWYDIKLSLSNDVRAHNNNIRSIIKFNPPYLFNNDDLTKLIKDIIKQSKVSWKKKRT